MFTRVIKYDTYPQLGFRNVLERYPIRLTYSPLSGYTFEEARCGVFRMVTSFMRKDKEKVLEYWSIVERRGHILEDAIRKGFIQGRGVTLENIEREKPLVKFFIFEEWVRFVDCNEIFYCGEWWDNFYFACNCVPNGYPCPPMKCREDFPWIDENKLISTEFGLSVSFRKGHDFSYDECKITLYTWNKPPQILYTFHENLSEIEDTIVLHNRGILDYPESYQIQWLKKYIDEYRCNLD